MTFTEFLRKQRKRDDRVGDFARDWLLAGQPGKPRGRYGFLALRRFLEENGACHAAIISAWQAWLEWGQANNSPTGTPVGWTASRDLYDRALARMINEPELYLPGDGSDLEAVEEMIEQERRATES